jgi:hypothetical protein
MVQPELRAKPKVHPAKQMEPELFMARLAEQAERFEDVFQFLVPVL